MVPLVAAVAFAAFLLMALFEMAGIYAGGTVTGAGKLTEPAVVAPDPSGSQDAAEGAGGQTRGDGSDVASTPRSQWRAGELPFLYQTDPQWSTAPYTGGTIGDSGCGPTSLAMVYIALTGATDKDPEAMASFSEENGYIEDGLTSWRLMSEGAAELGLASHEVPADAAQLVAELEAGRPVICSVRPGDFTTKGHFIVLAGMADNGQLVVHDPNSPANSARTWEVQRVLYQCRNLWAFERA